MSKQNTNLIILNVKKTISYIVFISLRLLPIAIIFKEYSKNSKRYVFPLEILIWNK